MGFGKPQVIDEEPSAVTAADWAALRERLTPGQQRLVEELPRTHTLPPAPAEARSAPTSAQRIIRMLREERAHIEPGFGPSGEVTELSVVPGADVPSCDVDHPYLADLSCDLPKGHTGEHHCGLSATLAPWSSEDEPDAV